jgi:hypothetical protein
MCLCAGRCFHSDDVFVWQQASVEMVRAMGISIPNLNFVDESGAYAYLHQTLDHATFRCFYCLVLIVTFKYWFGFRKVEF